MIDEEKIIKEIEKKEHKVLKNIRNNPWIAINIILGILIIVLLIITFNGGLTKKSVSVDDAGAKITEFAQTRGIDLKIIETKDMGSLYEVIVSINGEELPLYITKDGQYFVQGAIPLSETEESQTPTTEETNPKNVPKSDKPIIEAFIFSYCPYGLQFEKALFPVYDLLKDKADFRIMAIGAMHGEYEKTESLRQISIEKLYGTDKLFSYLKEFNNNVEIGSCRGDAVCLDKYIPDIYIKLKIDKSKVENYMREDALKIYDEQNARANSLGISGSPTFVINDAQVQVERTPDAIKEAVCNAFNTAPAECSNVISKDSPSPGFG